MSDVAPPVSVGLPVFNGEAYLELALESLLAQTYTDFELIISDNASTDRTQAICEVYAARDHRIRYYRNTRNLGSAPNFNHVFTLSRGKYFQWAASDDLMAPDYIAKCVEVLDQNPEVSLCYTKVKLIDEHGISFEDYDPRPNVSTLKPRERFRALILQPHLAPQCYGLIRASTLKKTMLFGSFASSDQVFPAELALYGRFYEYPERLFFYRRHAKQSTRGAMATQRSRMLWEDTSWEGKIVLAHWMYFMACLRVIRYAPLIAQDRVYCYAQMMRWLLQPPHFRAMGKDVLLAIRQIAAGCRHTLRARLRVLEGSSVRTSDR